MRAGTPNSNLIAVSVLRSAQPGENKRMPSEITAANAADMNAPAEVERDHMGRRRAATVGEAFRQDLPWVIALAALVAFVIAALAGYFR